MHMTTWRWGVVGLALTGLLMSACGEQAGQGPTTEEFSKEREALQARIAKNQGPKRKGKRKKAGAKGSAPSATATMSRCSPTAR